MFMHVYVSHVVKQNNTNDLLHATLNFGSVDYAECGVRSVENVECGKCGVCFINLFKFLCILIINNIVTHAFKIINRIALSLHFHG